MSKAYIVKVDSIEPINGADNIQVAYVLGERVIVSKSVVVGEVGIYFPAELQLSLDYVKENNLHRHKELNIDPDKGGFFEDNRRVRAQKFMEVKSEGYFAPIESLNYTKSNLSKLTLGSEFSEVGGLEVCRKYISEKTQRAMREKRKSNKEASPTFAQHIDTKQFKYYLNQLPIGATLSFHAKAHGTSARYAHLPVTRQKKQNIIQKLFRRPAKTTTAYEKIVGTRRVQLLTEDTQKEGFHGSEQFRFDWLDKLACYLDKGMTIYGELVGYANNAQIMGTHSTKELKDKKYTAKYGDSVVYKYGCPVGESRLIIYRITYTNEEGNSIDFTVDQLKAWAKKRGFDHTREVHPRLTYNGDSATLLNLVTQLTEREDVLTECHIDPTQVSEGIVIRVDFEDTTPAFYKNKSWAFKVMEGIFKEDNIDMEDAS